MRLKKEIREELIQELKSRNILDQFSELDIEYEVDARYHWERVVSEAEEIQKEHGSVKIEFMASPGDEHCLLCWQMNGKSLSIDQLKKLDNKWACRCALVFPEKEK